MIVLPTKIKSKQLIHIALSLYLYFPDAVLYPLVFFELTGFLDLYIYLLQGLNIQM